MPQRRSVSLRLVLLAHHAAAAGTYEQLARQSPGELHGRLLLRSAHEAVFANDAQRAENLLAQMSGTLPTEDLSLRARVVAGIDLLRQRPQAALTELSRIPQPRDKNSEPEVLELQVRAQFALQRPASAVATALERERILVGPESIRENRRLIWQGLRDAARAGADFTAPAGAGQAMEGWLALGRVALAAERDPSGARTALAQWQSRYANHPANEFLSTQVEPTLSEPLQYPVKIALILPLSGEYQSTGIAVRDGFFAALFQQNGNRPAVTVYDSAKEGAVTAYRHALAGGAQFVVGPLVKEEIAAIAQSGNVSTPTLALNFPDNFTPPPFMYQFALNPEEEARQVAGQIVSEGRLRGIALLPNTSTGKRLGQAFAAELGAHGGALLGTRFYDPGARDFSEPVTELLLINESNARRKSLARQLGTPLEFEPRVRGDLNFVFIGSEPTQGRALRPALRLHLPAGIPVYSTSTIFEPDVSANADLNDVIFVDMPWVISPDEISTNLRTALSNFWPSRSRGGRARLYAFGFDAYRLVPVLNSAKSPVNTLINGMTGQLSVDERGRVHRTLEWAQIVNGQVRPFDPGIRRAAPRSP